MYYIIKLNFQLVYATAYIKLYVQYLCQKAKADKSLSPYLQVHH